MRMGASFVRLVFYFSKRELINRTAGSLLGVLWAFLQPLVTVLIFIFLFSLVLRVKIGAGENTPSFTLFLLTGFLPWVQFQESVLRSCTVIIENREAVKKIAFPVESIVLGVNLAVHSIYAIPFAALILFCLAKSKVHVCNVPLLLLDLSVLYASQLMFSIGLSFFLSSLTVYVRDIPQLMFPALQVWFYMTPIVYPESMVPKAFSWFFKLNPWCLMVEAYRSVLIQGRPYNLNLAIPVIAVSTALLILGIMSFEKLKDGFADVL